MFVLSACIVQLPLLAEVCIRSAFRCLYLVLPPLLGVLFSGGCMYSDVGHVCSDVGHMCSNVGCMCSNVNHMCNGVSHVCRDVISLGQLTYID